MEFMSREISFNFPQRQQQLIESILFKTLAFSKPRWNRPDQARCEKCVQGHEERHGLPSVISSQLPYLSLGRQMQ
jgi:hypothetical protein